ncbi:NADH dehydrogenase [ubiquinone] 1 alpha subcomplex subunit 3 isoform X1 [Arvicanthis niloticus]|uniref:NADH dehydrogenase [ubiquinone] 1 alpha subcomplex subunit 3 isoform X1 n=1 Tax=Arvicanthis niloticus TaxID=61156 RepID=UPI00402B7BE2
MAGRISTFLKNAWAKEPVLVVSFTVWGLAIIMPMISPYTKYASMINRATPYNYPGSSLPVGDIALISLCLCFCSISGPYFPFSPGI